jgi:tRNA A37 threonylcarbamoyladenosine synthetase subunit TsaC/SUA5/YrdC
MLLEINPENPEPRKIQRALEALRSGEIIAYPTDTVYGIGCDLFNKKALDRLYQIKGRDRGCCPLCAKTWRRFLATPCCTIRYLG